MLKLYTIFTLRLLKNYGVQLFCWYNFYIFQLKNLKLIYKVGDFHNIIEEFPKCDFHEIQKVSETHKIL